MKRVAAGLLAFVSMCGCQVAFSTVGSWTREKGPPAPISNSVVIPLADGRLGFTQRLLTRIGKQYTFIWMPHTIFIPWPPHVS